VSAARRLLAFRPLVHAVQFAVTGERVPRRLRLLGEEVQRGPHGFVVDLGCGDGWLLRFVQPDRYIGVDEHEPSLTAARDAFAGPGREFVQSGLRDAPLERWHGADVVVISSVTHHLADDEIRALLARVSATVEPSRILLQDAEPTGVLGPVVDRLDEGDHLRPQSELVGILQETFEVRELWSYDNPLRSFHQFLLELRPRA
jgi:SAM-dependent methyltransferase